MPGPGSVRVCICTNQPSERVRETLESACAQARASGAPAPILVGSGLDPATAETQERQAAKLGARFLEAAAGAAAARNAGLALVADGDLIAYLDDDVLPAGDWLDRLAARWAEAPAEVVCIGGAVRPRWETPPPAWLGEGLATAFALLDLGDDVVELDPRRSEGVWTANASFRADALRRAGGFPLHLGPWRDVAIIGEDSAAQRRLAEQGGRIIYAGDVRVLHRIPAERLRLADLWRREALRGASEVLAGTSTPLRGAAAVPKAAAGVTVALTRRDLPLAGERFARLARSAGAAGTPLVRARLRRRGWPG